MESEYKYGIFRKHDERAIIKCRTREEAERLRRTNFIECEVKPLWLTLVEKKPLE